MPQPEMSRDWRSYRLKAGRRASLSVRRMPSPVGGYAKEKRQAMNPILKGALSMLGFVLAGYIIGRIVIVLALSNMAI